MSGLGPPAARTIGSAAVIRVAWRCLRIDGRRPAAWIVLVTAAAAAWHAAAVAAACGPPTILAVAIVVGGLLGVAAVGEPPGGRSDPLGVAVAGWLAARMTWPGAGVVGGWTLAGGWLTVWPVATCLAAAAAGVLVVRRVRRGDAVAAAAGLALWWVFTVAGIALSLPGEAPLAVALLLAAAVALLGVALAGIVSLATPVPDPRRLLGVADAGPVPLVAVAQIASLAGMAGWLFLARGRDWCFGLHALAWFAVLALPGLTLGAGSGGAAPRRLLCRTAVTSARGATARLADTRGHGPGPLEIAALLGWPFVVALALRAPEDRAGLAAVTGAVIAAAAVLGAGARLARAGGLAPDGVHAAVLCLVAAAAVVSGPLVAESLGPVRLEGLCSTCQTAGSTGFR